MVNNEIILYTAVNDTIWGIVTDITKENVTLKDATWFDIVNDEFENFDELVMPWNEILTYKVNVL